MGWVVIRGHSFPCWCSGERKWKNHINCIWMSLVSKRSYGPSNLSKNITVYLNFWSEIAWNVVLNNKKSGLVLDHWNWILWPSKKTLWMCGDRLKMNKREYDGKRGRRWNEMLYLEEDKVTYESKNYVHLIEYLVN